MTWNEPPVRRKRRWIGLVVALAVFLGLVATTLIIGEKLGRDLATDLVSGPVESALGLESGHPVDIDLGGGSLITQALGGSFDGVRVAVNGVPFGPASADVVLTATDVPLDTSKSVGSLAATVVLDEAAMLALGAQLTAAPLASVDLADGQLNLATTAAVLGQELPATIALSPSVVDGTLALTVSSMAINGGPVDVAQAQAGAFGPAAQLAATPRSLCLAQYLPAALTLADVTVAGDELVIGFTGTDVPLTGGGLATKGTC